MKCVPCYSIVIDVSVSGKIIVLFCIDLQVSQIDYLGLKTPVGRGVANHKYYKLMKRLVCHTLILRPISAVCLYLDGTAATFSLALCVD